MVRGLVTLRAHGVAGLVIKAGEVAKAGPVLVLETAGALAGSTDHVCEGLWMESR